MVFDYVKRPLVRTVDFDKFMSENRVIAHPDDYVKLAESGVVKTLVDGGVSVVMSEYVEKGKLIATGELAKSIVDEKHED